jgi:hypothetical protein
VNDELIFTKSDKHLPGSKDLGRCLVGSWTQCTHRSEKRKRY